MAGDKTVVAIRGILFDGAADFCPDLSAIRWL